MQLKRVVVTGLGALTPIGNSVQEYWNSLLNGKSGAAPILRFDASKFKTRFACEIKDFNAQDHFEKKEIRRLDLYSQYALVASHQAWMDAGFNEGTIDLERAGVIWGSGMGGVGTFFDSSTQFLKDGSDPKFLSPVFLPKLITNIASGHISIRYGFKGPNFTTVSACASSTNALIDAFNYIRLGTADVIISGGSEAAVNELAMAGFNAIHALSTRNDSPLSASRPFDKDRDGFVMGEGAGALVLEEYEHAIKRGAKIYAEVAGGGMAADAHHITAPHPEGAGAMRVMKNALRDSGMNPDEIDYVNLHGTSTLLGDVAEARAISNLFGTHSSGMNISSTKSMTGHLLGAAGAIEAIASVLTVKNDVVPPTINHFENDPMVAENLNFTFNKFQRRTVRASISNTFGFGGHNASIIFKKSDEAA